MTLHSKLSKSTWVAKATDTAQVYEDPCIIYARVNMFLRVNDDDQHVLEEFWQIKISKSLFLYSRNML